MENYEIFYTKKYLNNRKLYYELSKSLEKDLEDNLCEMTNFQLGEFTNLRFVFYVDLDGELNNELEF